MVEFFKSLPWYIQVPGRIIAAVCGGYVSNHPEIFPSWAVIVGAVVALWVVIAFLWHALNTWREHHGKQRLRLDPQVILIACLVVALGAAIWQWWRDPKIAALQSQVTDLTKQIATATPDTKVEELRSQLETARREIGIKERELETTKQQLAKAKQPPPEKPATNAKPYYSNADREQIIEALKALDASFAKVAGVPDQINIMNQLSSRFNRIETAPSLEKVTTLARLVADNQREVRKEILPRNSVFANELAFIINDVAMNGLGDSLQRFEAMLSDLKSATEISRRTLEPTILELVKAAGAYGVWVGQNRQHIVDEIKKYREWQNER